MVGVRNRRANKVVEGEVDLKVGFGFRQQVALLRIIVVNHQCKNARF